MEEKLGKIVFDGRIYDLDNCEPEKKPPFLTLLISGGNTQLVLV